MKDNLTDEQLRILIHLVRREVRYEGYGSAWFSDNRSCWPRRLKRLHVIARKLNNMKETGNVT